MPKDTMYRAPVEPFYTKRVERLATLIKLKAPASVIETECFLIIHAVQGRSWLRVLRMVLNHLKDHTTTRIGNLIFEARCNTWCWWHKRTRTDYCTYREMKDFPETQEPEEGESIH
jgi:hypothetical protein